MVDAGTALDHDLSVGQRIKVVTSTGPGRVHDLRHHSSWYVEQPAWARPSRCSICRPPRSCSIARGNSTRSTSRGTAPSRPISSPPASAPCCPTGYQAITAASAAAEQQDQVGQGLGFLRTFFLIFGFVALFVGAFIIFNTFNIVVSQRSRELALFRALGAPPATGDDLRDGGVGDRRAHRLARRRPARHGPREGPRGAAVGLGLQLPPTALVVASRTIIVSIVLGTGITMAAAYPPARRAGRLAPLEALRDSRAPSASIRRRVVVGSLITIAGIAAIGLALFGDVSNAGLVVGLGAALTFLGVAMLSPLFAKPISAVIGRPFRGKIAGRLGVENANRNPRRTASTAAALMIGLGLVAFVSVFAASLKASATADARRGAGRRLHPVVEPVRAVLAAAGEGSVRRQPVLHRVGAAPEPRRMRVPRTRSSRASTRPRSPRS